MIEAFVNQNYVLLRFILPFACVIILFIWCIISGTSLIQPKGHIRRGYKIWRKPLLYQQQQYLRKLKDGTIYPKPEQQKYVSSLSLGLDEGIISAFLMKENDEVVIYGGHPTARPFGYIVGYVDLWLEEPKLEFRTPMSIKWIVILLIPSVVFQPFLILPFLLGFLTQTGYIQKLLTSLAEEFNNKK